MHVSASATSPPVSEGDSMGRGRIPSAAALSIVVVGVGAGVDEDRGASKVGTIGKGKRRGEVWHSTDRVSGPLGRGLLAGASQKDPRSCLILRASRSGAPC